MGHRLTRFLGLLLLFQTMAVPALWTSVRASEANKAPPTVLKVDVFWSMRSPYCYIALDRILEMQKKYNVRMNLRPVWPIAIWDPEFLKGIEWRCHINRHRASFGRRMSPFMPPLPLAAIASPPRRGTGGVSSGRSDGVGR
jgi:hypothetical protein